MITARGGTSKIAFRSIDKRSESYKDPSMNVMKINEISCERETKLLVIFYFQCNSKEIALFDRVVSHARHFHIK